MSAFQTMSKNVALLNPYGVTEEDETFKVKDLKISADGVTTAFDAVIINDSAQDSIFKDVGKAVASKVLQDPCTKHHRIGLWSDGFG